MAIYVQDPVFKDDLTMNFHALIVYPLPPSLPPFYLSVVARINRTPLQADLTLF